MLAVNGNAQVISKFWNDRAGIQAGYILLRNQNVVGIGQRVDAVLIHRDVHQLVRKLFGFRLIGGGVDRQRQLAAGFVLKDVYQDTNGYGKLEEYGVPTFWATKAVKPV